MTNEEMIAGRFERWADFRRMLAKIEATLAMNGEVHIVNSLRIIRCTAKHAGMFRATKAGLYVQNRKRWDAIHYCQIRHYRPR